jgi:hypothetical protein
MLEGEQPLATLAWPRSADEARAMPRLPLDFVRCVACGHVYNARFEYGRVPYSTKPNLMFNRGVAWAEFLEGVLDRLAARLPPDALVVEVGHGDGSFLSALATRRADVRCIGFDPHGAEHRADRVELRRSIIEPEMIPALGAHLLVARHVLEHLERPLAVLQRVAYAASTKGTSVEAYLEVPCVDRALSAHRTVDFFYEHGSQFTTRSFETMLERAGASVALRGHGYDGEVVWAIASLGSASASVSAFAREATEFRVVTEAAIGHVGAQLAALAGRGVRVAVWGGTGKSSAFMVRYGVDATRFPLVVDSDAEKVGTYVPGTGQRIEDAASLDGSSVDVVLVPPQWRARDIITEMRRRRIRWGSVLIEHDGHLVDFEKDSHPYAR